MGRLGIIVHSKKLKIQHRGKCTNFKKMYSAYRLLNKSHEASKDDIETLIYDCCKIEISKESKVSIGLIEVFPGRSKENIKNANRAIF